MGKQWKQWDFIFWGSKIAADVDCSHEIKRRLLLGRKTMTNLAAAAAAAKSLQSCPTLWDPRDSSPPGSPVPGILQARTLEWVTISFSNAWKWKVKVKSVAQLCPTPRDPMDCSLLGSSVHGICQARVLEWVAIAVSNDKPTQCIKKQRHHFANKDPSSQSYGFSISWVQMWELDHKKDWVMKN